MQRKFMKNLMLVLTLAVLCLAVGMSASALDATGQCGDNVYWTYNETTGELVISGEGDMWDYSWPKSPFYDSDIESIKIADSVTRICDEAFSYCENLKSVEMSNNLVTIGNEAFYHCDSLTSIDIPDSVITIGEYAFAYCCRLSVINIGSGTENIEKNAFSSCNSLTRIIVDENNNFYFSDDSGVLFNKDKTALIKYPSNNSNKKYEIPNNVTMVCESAFTSCYNLTEISIPNSVEIIDEWAFNGCLRLTNIVVPESLKTLRMCSFSAILFLEKIVVKSMDAEIEPAALCYSQIKVLEDVLPEYFIELFARYEMTNDDELWEELYQYIAVAEDDELFSFGTIYCHAGSTAEAYAIENGCDFELTHFYEGDWTYDYDNLVRYRKCIHCEELETEDIEPELPTEPETPADPEPEIPAEPEPEEPAEPDTPVNPEPDTPAEPEEMSFAERLIDLIKAFFELLKNLFGK